MWRQLQSTNPDLTGAISNVIQREKDKTEQKDKKVLEILGFKDDQIEVLQKGLEKTKTELAQLSEKLKSTECELSANQDELSLIQINLKTSLDKEKMFEQMLRLRDDKIETLASRVKELEAENGLVKVECQQHRQTEEIMEKQIKQTTDNYEKLVGELNQFRLSIDNSLKSENDKLKGELKLRIEQCNKQSIEFDELLAKLNSQIDYVGQQEKIIKKLKQMQSDFQKTIKTQQLTQDTLERENSELKQMYEQISMKYEQCKANEKYLIEEAEFAKDRMAQMQFSQQSNADFIKAQKFEIDKLKLQIELQIEQLDDKQILCEELTQRLVICESSEFKNVIFKQFFYWLK